MPQNQDLLVFFTTFRRNRLHIIGRAHVRKIIFDAKAGEKHRAIGVVYVRDGKEVEVRATKEVIISAGAIGSPQLLMLSGIGPKNHLEEVGVIYLK